MSYIGPERRWHIEDRRSPPRYHRDDYKGEERRTTADDRRQEGLSGVIMGLTANDMSILRNFWERYERTRDFNTRAGSC